MSTQKQRHTKARRDRARVMHKIASQKLIVCPKCGAKILPHKACAKCGFYKGKEVVNTMKKANKKAKK
jgi:large subunit ribosomal protein L32